MTQFTTLDLRFAPLPLKNLRLRYYCFFLAGVWDENILVHD